MLKNQQLNKNKTKAIRIDISLHKLLKIEAAESGETLRSLIEGYIAEGLGPVGREKSDASHRND